MRDRYRQYMAKATTQPNNVTASTANQEKVGTGEPTSGARTISIAWKNGLKITISAGPDNESACQRIGVRKNTACIALVTICGTSRKRADTSPSSSPTHTPLTHRTAT